MTDPSVDAPLDAAAGPGSAAGRLAAALRELRTSAGSPSFRTMGKEANYAPSTLSDAIQGKRMPTRAVTEAFARACGADPGEWGRRWEQAMAEASGAFAAVPDAADAPVRQHSTRRALALNAGLVVTTAAVTAAVTWSVVPRGSSSPTAATAPTATATASAFALPSDGKDPAAAGCGPDATVLGEMPVVAGSSGSGVIELKYSPRCQAGWARFYLNPNSAPMPAEVRLQASDGRASSFAYLAEGNTPVYTDLLHPTGGCLTASVVIHPQNQEPITAATPCIQGK